jgi:signal transduction histidine kinase
LISTILRKMRPQKPHLAVLVGVLAGMFLLTVTLAYYAHDAYLQDVDRTHAMLRDDARTAATEWANRATTAFLRTEEDIFYSSAVFLVNDAPSLPRIVAGFEGQEKLAFVHFDRIGYYFLYDAASGLIVTDGKEPEGTLEWLAGALPVHPRASVAAEFKAGFLNRMVNGEARTILFIMHERAREDSTSVAHLAFGFETDGTFMKEVLEGVTASAEKMLSNRTSEERKASELLSIALSTADGDRLYATVPENDSEFTGTVSFMPGFPPYRVTATINPDALDVLVPGGQMPRSRLPLYALLLAVNATLVGAAVFLLRREAEITRLRSDFIAGVSHELRTPLAQIRMFAETLMLNRVRSEGERLRSLEIIDQEARRLAHLVENVLLFARSERDTTRINPELVDLAGEIRAAVHGFAVLCRSKNVEIVPDLQEGVAVHIDRGSLRQVMLNLLDNAVKYGPLSQRITVGMALFDRHVRIWVDDEGPGIPPADRERVFESFYRLGRDIASPVAGSGIGLSLVRELCRLHDGRAWIEGAPGGGARVITEFPVAYLRPEIAATWAVA